MSMRVRTIVTELTIQSKCETQTKGRVLERVEFSDRFVWSFDGRVSLMMKW